MMPNLLQYPIAIFGVLRAGMTVVHTNQMYTARELTHQLVDSGASAIVVLDNFAHTVAAVLPGTSVKKVLRTSVADLLQFPKGAIVHILQIPDQKKITPSKTQERPSLRRRG